MEQVPEPTFDPAKSYVLSGATLAKLWRWVRARTPVAGAGITLEDTADGVIIKSAAVAVDSSTPAAFYNVFQSGGKWWLQGGQVTGSVGNESVSAIELATIGSEPADGEIWWLEITGSGLLSDGGRLYPGFEVTNVTVESGSSLPANTVPEIGAHTGRKYHLRLGEWMDERFLADAAGAVQIGFCGNSYTIDR